MLRIIEKVGGESASLLFEKPVCVSASKEFEMYIVCVVYCLCIL